MPKVDDENVDTQQIDDEIEQGQDIQGDEDGHSASDADDDGEQGEQQFFLDVDERHRYRTADEAKKAVSEASARIAELSAWNKELKEYGELTPQDVRGYLDELIQLRQAAKEAQDQIKQFNEEKQRGQKESKSDSADPAEALTADEKAARAWLKKAMPELGYVPKSEVVSLVQALQEKVGKFESYQAQQQEQYKESLVSDSRGKVQSWMKDAGFTDDEDGSLQLMIEAGIRDFVNADDRRVTRFYTGGSTTEKVIKEGYDRVAKALGLVRTQSSTTYAQNKAAALARNGKKMPSVGSVAMKPGIPGKPGQKPNSGKRIDASGKRDFIGEQHNKAWELANRKWAGANQEE